MTKEIGDIQLDIQNLINEIENRNIQLKGEIITRLLRIRDDCLLVE